MARLSRSTSWFTKLVCIFGIRLSLVLLTLIPLLWIGSSSTLVWAQAFNAAAISGQVATPTGQVAVNAQVRICTISSAGFPCTPTSQVFADDNLTILLPNPLSTDQYGNYKAFVKAGLYLVQVSLGGSGAQPTYTYYVSAGAGGALSSPPPGSIQFASTLPGEFSSDPLIFIDPTNHIVTSPEFYSPGSGTGIIEIAGVTSGSAVTLTVDPNTQAWTFTLPTQAATVNGACLTSLTTGVSTWSAGCGNPSSAPVNSVQIASSTPGLFNSDASTTVNPTTHLFSSPDINNSYVAGSTIYSSISAALTAAGTSGSVTVPAGYPGAAAFTGGSNNTRVFDQRPFNPGNVASFSTQVEPGTTIKASEFGALCNGVADDWPGIQAAVNALTNIVGIQQGGSQLMVNGTVELPQGRCNISQSIVLTNWGSLQGSANGTWITPGPTWSGNGAMVVMTQSFAQSGYLNQSTLTINRFVRGINFYYNANTVNITGVEVINPTGHTSAQPYPVGAQFALYQLPGVIIQNNTFYAMDTAIDLEDCGECVVENNQVFFVKTGVVDDGNNYSLRLVHNAIQAGSWLYTATPSGPTEGIFTTQEIRWILVSSTPTQDLVVAPQGLDIADSITTSFDQDLHMDHMEGAQIHDSGFDYGGAGGQGCNSGQNPTVYFGDLNWIIFHHNQIATNCQAGNGLEVLDATSTPVDSDNLDGTWITDNFFQSYAGGPTGAAIAFDTGTDCSSAACGHRNVYIERNQFNHIGYGAFIQQPLTYSVIRENYAFSVGGALIVLDAPGTNSFQGTIIQDNTTSDPINALTDTAGGGYVTGFNMSGSNSAVVQLIGTFTATGSGCPISGGAIGDTCAVTMTNQLPFADTAYIVTGCSITGPSNPAHMGYITTPSLGTQFSVAEVADSTSAVSGGSVACTVVHK